MIILEYDFELYMDSSYKELCDCDEWGCAIVSVTDPNVGIDDKEWRNYGAEYNFCKDNGEDSSAIYLFDDTMDSSHTYHDVYEHYEIDFEDEDWENKLKQAMLGFVKDCEREYLV